MKCIATTLLILSAAYAANSQTAFPTGVTSYVYVGAAGPNASTEPLMLYTSTNVAGATFTNATTVTGVTGKVNGLGLNRQDGFLYGIGFSQAASSSSNFYRMGSDGVTQQVGVIPPPLVPGAPIALINTTAGMVDANDNYYFTAYTYSGNPLSFPYQASNMKFFVGVVPSVSALTNGATASLSPIYHEVNVSDPALQLAFQDFFNNFDYVNPGNSDGGVEDIAISPVDGKIYSYMSYPDPGNNNALVGRPVAIDPATWVAAPVGTTINTAPGLEIAGAYFSASNNYYVLFTDGSYTQVNLVSGAIGTLAATNLPLVNGTLRGDLASNPIISTLPITLKDFHAKATANGNQLDWSTAMEQNMNNFTLQRSADGYNFQPLTTVAAKGAGSNYTYTDTKPYTTSYYRLKMADNDGTWRYSQVAAVTATGQNTGAIVYPSVLQDNNLYVQTTGTNIRVTISGMDGKVISNNTYASGTGKYMITLPQMSAGMYIVHVGDNNNGNPLATQKIIIE